MTTPVITPADAARMPIDAATIRKTYNTAFQCSSSDPEVIESLKGRLVGHIELLTRELRAAVPGMQDPGRRGLADHVLGNARELVDARPGPGSREQASHLHGLATSCRALLVLLVDYPGTKREDADE